MIPLGAARTRCRNCGRTLLRHRLINRGARRGGPTLFCPKTKVHPEPRRAFTSSDGDEVSDALRRYRARASAPFDQPGLFS